MDEEETGLQSTLSRNVIQAAYGTRLHRPEDAVEQALLAAMLLTTCNAIRAEVACDKTSFSAGLPVIVLLF